jgi:uncharacterized protein YndB with AHSA1/START domain
LQGSDVLGKTKKTIIIKSQPEKVWEMLALDRYPEWSDMMESVEYTSEVKNSKDRYRVGATALGTPKGGPPNNCHYEIIDSVENEKITHRMWEKWDRGTLSGSITYTLEPVEAGTKFTYLADYEIPFGILGKIISPLIMIYGGKELGKALKNLKTILEK